MILPEVLTLLPKSISAEVLYYRRMPSIVYDVAVTKTFRNNDNGQKKIIIPHTAQFSWKQKEARI